MKGKTFHASRFESHNSLGMGEQFHTYPKTVFNKVHSENPDVHETRALPLTMNAINDSAGPNELVTTLLVFERFHESLFDPNGFIIRSFLQKTLNEAQEETVKLVARSGLASANTSKIFVAADSDIKTGDEVPMFTEKPTTKWNGRLPL